MVRFPEPVRRGRLLARRQRFLADVALADGTRLTVHCANPGSMLGVSTPGSTVVVSRSPNPARKLPWSLEAIRVGPVWVGVHPVRANRVVAEALAAGRIPCLRRYSRIRAEAAWGARSRADFLLEAEGLPPAWVEVKNVTLARGRLALFPDAVTERGRRHLEELARRARAGEAAVLLLVASRPDVTRVGPADGIDPAFGHAFREARRAGVRVLGYGMRVTPRGLVLGQRLRIAPGPHAVTRKAWIEDAPRAQPGLPRSRPTP